MWVADLPVDLPRY